MLLHTGGLEVVLEISHDTANNGDEGRQPSERTTLGAGEASAAPVWPRETKQRRTTDLPSGTGPPMPRQSLPLPPPRDAAFGVPQGDHHHLFGVLEDPSSRQQEGGGGACGAVTRPEVYVV